MVLGVAGCSAAQDATPGADAGALADASALADATRPPPPVAAPWGIDTRPANLTCVAPNRPPSDAAVKLVRAFAPVTLAQPMHLAAIPGDSSRLVVAQRAGTVVSFSTSAPGATPTTVLTVPRPVNTAGEGGLLGFAFHPNFATNGQLFLSFTTTGGATGMRSVIARMTSTDHGASFAASTYAEIVGPFEQPFTNHNGGDLHFGPLDGYLYASFGDGGSAGDPLGHGQNTNLFFSKILRIDVDHPSGGRAYGIPTSNPFSSGGGEPATFAFGLRNPFRFSIDRATGQVWAGDVGQDKWEEIDRIALGGNYGWSQREGKHCYKPMTNCQTAGLIDPVWEYDHTQGQSMTGGVVYRGSSLASMVGRYVFGDYQTGRVWYLTDGGASGWSATEVSDRGGGSGWVAFGEDAAGEVFAVSINNGGIYQLVAAGAPTSSNFPATLKATGCVDPTDATKPSAGMIPFEPVSQLWSDGAQKGRYFAIPEGSHISILPSGHFDFPVGSVMVKSFAIGGKLIETRLLTRHTDGGWAGYSYKWNASQTDANLLLANETDPVGAQNWYFPSRAECSRCHTSAAGSTLGPEVLQLNSNYVYPTTNRNSNQLATLDHIGVLSAPLPAPEQLPAMPAVAGAAPLESRARAYLHANCSGCHRPEGGGGGNLDLRYDTKLSATAMCGLPQAGDLAITGARIVAPGDPARSVLLARMRRLDSLRMPPLGSALVDTVGTGVIEQWIQSLAQCP